MRTTASRIALGIAGATLALIVVSLVVAGFQISALSWRTTLADFLVASVLAYAVWAARGPRAHGWQLAASVALLYFGISYVNTLDEAVAFLDLPRLALIGGLTVGLVNALMVAVVLNVLMDWLRATPASTEALPPHFSGAQWLWRLVAGDLAYIVLYFVAGFSVYPFVKDFYASKSMPAFSTIILMQIFRALIYIVVALPVARSIPDRRHAALALGLAFAVLGGIAPLLPDNPFMPANVRFAHSIEVGISNFIYGVILACLFSPKAPAPLRSVVEQAA